MEKKIQKKEWKTPELIILVRSKPEEVVLAACKTAGSAVGPSTKSPCSASPANCRASVTS